MQGLTMASLKKNPALIPLYVCIAMGSAGAVFYTLRLALKSPEVTWSRKNNPEPWEEYRNKQHKVTRRVALYKCVVQQFQNDPPSPR
uniref:NADH dehydrogenase [ubiquinone] 1 alpha subcomplex subunit 4 n=1 Tax=Anopheles coluzzii TaxID=1518534 RepID=A0A8W7PQ96_ANOCL